MNFEYNSQEEIYKIPFGAVSVGTSISFTIKAPSTAMAFLHGFDKTYKMIRLSELFTIKVNAPRDPTLIYYYFEVQYNNRSYFITPKTGVGGKCKIGNELDKKYQLTVYKNSPTPDWFKGAVMYQIYVDRFFRPTNNPPFKKNILFHTSWDDKPLYIFNSQNRIVEWDFFGGNLRGVIEKLDYLKGLGVDIIYFNPIFESSSNHKYDTGDYSKVDSMYGDEEILKELIVKSKSKGMHIILDGVFSHVGDDSIYFNKYKSYDSIGAYQSKDSQYYSWFNFNKYPDDYKSWWGIDALPEINKNNESYRDFLFNKENGIIKKWMELGIMGWRLDVADELPDDFIKQLKQTIKSLCNAPILLGEVWEDASNKISYGMQRRYITDDSLDSVSNYPLRDCIINYLLGKCSSYDLSRLVMTLQENYPSDVFNSMMNLTGTHDSIRLSTLLGNAPDEDKLDLWEKRDLELDGVNYDIAIKRTKLFFIILFTLPGNPCIYYGDETAVQGYKDPYNRSTFPWGETREDLHDLIVHLSNIRYNNIAFKCGFYKYNLIDENILSYTITDDNTQYKVVINRSATDNYTTDLTYSDILLSINIESYSNNIIIKPFGAIVLKVS